jgi:hypothetical protein
MLGCAACAEIQRQLHADFQLFLRYAVDHAWNFQAAFKLNDADGVGSQRLELLGRHMYD